MLPIIPLLYHETLGLSPFCSHIHRRCNNFLITSDAIRRISIINDMPCFKRCLRSCNSNHTTLDQTWLHLSELQFSPHHNSWYSSYIIFNLSITVWSDMLGVKPRMFVLVRKGMQDCFSNSDLSFYIILYCLYISKFSKISWKSGPFYQHLCL